MLEVGLESRTGRVTGKSTPSLWRDKRPAIKGLGPPEHHAGHSIRTKQTPPIFRNTCSVGGSAKRNLGESVKRRRFLFARNAFRRMAGSSRRVLPEPKWLHLYPHWPLRPISLLRLSLLRFVDSNFQGNSLWAWESYPLE